MAVTEEAVPAAVFRPVAALCAEASADEAAVEIAVVAEEEHAVVQGVVVEAHAAAA